MMRHWGALAVLVASTVVAGCGGGDAYDPAETVAITGTIKIDGKLTGDVEVIFYAVGGDDRTSGSLAISDQDGRFSLPEVLPGEYRVQIDKQVNGAPDPALSAYGENSPLKAVVSVGKTTFDFEATRK